MPSKKLIKDIKKILICANSPVAFKSGQAMSVMESCDDACIAIEADRIISFGKKEKYNPKEYDQIISANNGYILPSFVDSHTHLVFAAWRETEFMDRIQGMSYEEISLRGGGILNSAKRIEAISEDDLFELSLSKLKKVIQCGTGAIEIKSGYGLSTASELKMLRVIKRLKQLNLIPIKATFLGAHSYPLQYRTNHQGYIDILTEEILPEIAAQGLADYCDVFCEANFFSPLESNTILNKAKTLGLGLRIHTNQFTHSGGIQLAIELGAQSVDHLEVLNEEEIHLLQKSEVIPCLLPGAAFYMNCSYPPARTMIDRGIGFSIASDFNPGTCPIWDMKTILNLSAIKLRLSSAESLNAMTVNAAFSLSLDRDCGSIFPGALANFIITKDIPSEHYMPYAINDDWIASCYVNGDEFRT